MTKEELYNKHYDTLNTGGHANISVEYAISILEELRVPLKGARFPDYHNLPVAIESKIEELKKLIE